MYDDMQGVPAKVKVAMHVLHMKHGAADQQMVKDARDCVCAYLQGKTTASNERKTHNSKPTMGQKVAAGMGY